MVQGIAIPDKDKSSLSSMKPKNDKITNEEIYYVLVEFEESMHDRHRLKVFIDPSL